MTELYYVYRQTIMDLENPLLESNKLNDIFNTYQCDIKYVIEPSISNMINYFKNAFDNILLFDVAKDDENKLIILVNVVDKYLYIMNENIQYLQSDHILTNAFIKAIIHQIWQRIYMMFKYKKMTFNDINEAIVLYNENICDILLELKKCDIIKF